MFDDDEGPKDWEIKDEEPPEKLQKKWEREEAQGVLCPSCKRETSAEHLTCIFCGATISQESCSFRCLLSWVKRLFGKG